MSREAHVRSLWEPGGEIPRATRLEKLSEGADTKPGPTP
jgi:hypothetical protein